MLNAKRIYDFLIDNGVDFFTGVPDSCLNGFCNYVLAKTPREKHIIAANEGNAIAIAAGHYFATQNLPLVYMQNSGIGNAVNPLVSLTNEEVYGVPMLIFIGWRGKPNTGDWPQHKLQGAITPALLETMKIPYDFLQNGEKASIEVLKKAISEAKSTRHPYGIIVPKGLLDGDKCNSLSTLDLMSREEVIEIVLETMPVDTIYSATTGRATRELFFLRERRGESKKNDFLNVGSMGHASSVALGIALEHRERNVVVLDGDAAAIMHLGAMAVIGQSRIPNYLHVILNNGSHESVGGQPSVGHSIDFTNIADTCGYETIHRPVFTKGELVEVIKAATKVQRPFLIDVRIRSGLAAPLPPLDFSHREAIDLLIGSLNDEQL